MTIDKIRKTIEKFKLIEKGDKIIVAVSGGADSTALLFLLLRLKGHYDLKLYIAHLDHMIRKPGQRRDDYGYIRRLSLSLQLPLIFRKVDVPRYAKESGLSLEEAARNKRYEFLLSAARETGASKIALGHTLDDQAETILMRLIRGSGLSGLRGIPVSRDLEDRQIIRPLLEVWRRDIDTYLRDLDVKPAEDVTNFMPKFFRNRIRLEAIGFLQKYNPNIKETLARTAQSLTYDYEVLAKMIEKSFRSITKTKNGSVWIELRNFKRKPIGLRRGILRRAIESLKGDLRDIDYSHIEKIEGLIEAGRGSLDLPNKLRVAVANSAILFGMVADSRERPARVMKRLSVPGVTYIPELKLSFETAFVKGRLKSNKRTNVEYMDFEETRGPLYVRRWRKGDRFRPLGMSAHKKLQDFFVDEKIPRDERNNIPLVVQGRRIIWVCGYRLSDEVKISDGTRRILKISYKQRF